MFDFSTIENEEQLNKYFEVGKHKLSKGAFGAVYPVWDKKIPVAAVKRIAKAKHKDNEVRILFLLKFKVGGSLDTKIYMLHSTINNWLKLKIALIFLPYHFR